MIIIKKLKVIITEDYICLYNNQLIKTKFDNIFLNGYLIDTQKLITIIKSFLKNNKLNNGIFMNNIYVYTQFFNIKTVKKISNIFKNLFFKKVIINNNFFSKIENDYLHIHIYSKTIVFLIKKYNKKIIKYINKDLLIKQKDLALLILKYTKYLHKNYKINSIKISDLNDSKKVANFIETKTCLKTYYIINKSA